METLLEDLLVQTGTIEACLHGKFDIVLESLIAGSRPDTIGIKTLVENQALIEGFIVEICLVTYAMEFAHAYVGCYLIYNITLSIPNLVGKVIKEWTLRAPQLRCLNGQDERRGIRSVGCLAGHPSFRDDWYVVPFLPDHMFTMEGHIMELQRVFDDGKCIRYFDGDEEKAIPYQDEKEADRIAESVHEYLDSIREPAENGRVIASDDIDLSEMCGDNLPSGHYRLIKGITLMDSMYGDCVADYDVVAEFDL